MSTDWVGPRGDRRPAPVTRLTSVNAGPVPQVGTNETPRIDARLNQYDEAFNAKDLGRLGTFYHADGTVYDGGGVTAFSVEDSSRNIVRFDPI